MPTPPPAPLPAAPPAPPANPWARTLLTGHGGAGAYAPDNSRAAFLLAIEMGADVLECDIHMTRDGTLVLAHDGIIGQGKQATRIAWETAASLRQRVPDLLTLDDLLDLAITHGLLLNVDLKGPDTEIPLVAMLRRRNYLGRTVATSRASYQLRRLRALAPGMRLGLSKGSNPPRGPHGGPEWAALLSQRALLPRTLPGILRRSHADVALLQWRLITPPLVAALHAAGFGLYAWTVDDASVAARLAAWGMDGITTNRPDVIRPLIANEAQSSR